MLEDFQKTQTRGTIRLSAYRLLSFFFSPDVIPLRCSVLANRHLTEKGWCGLIKVWRQSQNIQGFRNPYYSIFISLLVFAVICFYRFQSTDPTDIFELLSELVYSFIMHERLLYPLLTWSNTTFTILSAF